MNLFHALTRLAQLQGDAVSSLALREAVHASEQGGDSAEAMLATVTQSLHAPRPVWVKNPSPTDVPALLCDELHNWGVLVGCNAQQQWVAEWFDEAGTRREEVLAGGIEHFRIARLRLNPPHKASGSPVFRLAIDEFFASKTSIFEASLGAFMLNLVAIGTSLYSMQVYDRVVPTGAMSTLQVLTLGVMVAIVFEFVVKLIRSHIFNSLIDRTDTKLARSIYLKFLETRLDQLPSSVGGLAAQMRGYETVRSFLSAVTASVTVDAPLAIVYVFMMAALGGWIAAIPCAFVVVAIGVGLYYRRQMEALARKSNQATNLKTGLLVEAIEGAETIKSGQGGWRMLSGWMRNTDEARASDTRMRNLSEHSQYVTAVLQQISYVALVAAGAMAITEGRLSMGALIACTILSGRVLAPVAMIPNLYVQWGHCKAALVGLDKLWGLEGDHHGIDQPVVLSKLRGEYELENVQYSYRQQVAINIESLKIAPGERVGVIGPIGSGKTTFLRLLSGMYKPKSGSIFLDGIEISHLSKPVLAENIGYLQQEGRLFAGTLRDNLVLGMLDPGDTAVLEAAQKTGLLDHVIRRHPQGLQQPIFEGGQGLSGGQRQLVNLTRVLLRKPLVWLLDEPTASIDQALENHIQKVLQETLSHGETLVLVTHKPEMLNLVDRVIVIINQKIVLDDTRDKVLSMLSTNGARKVQAASKMRVAA